MFAAEGSCCCEQELVSLAGNLLVCLSANFFLHDTSGYAQFDGFVVAHFEYSFLLVPDAACPAYFALQCDLLQADCEFDEVVGFPERFSRYPIAFFDNEFHGLIAFPLHRVIAVADTDQPIAINGEELFAASFTGFDSGACARSFQQKSLSEIESRLTR